MPSSVVSTTMVAVLVDPSGGRTLRLRQPSGLALPVVSVPQRVSFPDATVLMRALLDQHGLDAIALECLHRQESPDAAGGIELEVLLELRPGAVLPPTATWVPDVPARAAAALGRSPDHPATPAWSRPGWYVDAYAWIVARLAEVGRSLTGPPEQVRIWGLSAVLRCPTTDGAVYFKAAGHASTIRPVGPDPEPLFFAHEARLLDLLARERPDAGPQPIAVDLDRVWLLLPDLGDLLESISDVAVWADALRRHARLQRSYVDETDRLLAVGCVDRRLARLDAEVDGLLGPNRITERLEVGVRDRLARLGPHVHALIAELDGLGLPETLVHSDLHPRNVAVRGARTTVFDWTDAAVAHPFLDLVTFFEERSAVAGDPATVEQLRAAYLSEWTGIAAPDLLLTAYGLAQRIAPVHQAVSYLHLVDSVSGVSREGIARGGVYWLTTLVTQET